MEMYLKIHCHCSEILKVSSYVFFALSRGLLCSAFANDTEASVQFNIKKCLLSLEHRIPNMHPVPPCPTTCEFPSALSAASYSLTAQWVTTSAIFGSHFPDICYLLNFESQDPGPRISIYTDSRILKSCAQAGYCQMTLTIAGSALFSARVVQS